jgi:hypothetical protein
VVVVVCACVWGGVGVGVCVWGAGGGMPPFTNWTFFPAATQNNGRGTCKTSQAFFPLTFISSESIKRQPQAKWGGASWATCAPQPHQSLSKL